MSLEHCAYWLVFHSPVKDQSPGVWHVTLTAGLHAVEEAYRLAQTLPILLHLGLRMLSVPLLRGTTTEAT